MSLLVTRYFLLFFLQNVLIPLLWVSDKEVEGSFFFLLERDL